MDSEAKIRHLKREIEGILNSLIDPLLCDEDLKILNDKVNFLMCEKRILEGGGREVDKYLYFGRAAELEEVQEIRQPFYEPPSTKEIEVLSPFYYGDDVGGDFLTLEEEYEMEMEKKMVLPDFITKISTKLPKDSSKKLKDKKLNFLKIPTNQEMEAMIVQAHKKRLTALVQERYSEDH